MKKENIIIVLLLITAVVIIIGIKNKQQIAVTATHAGKTNAINVSVETPLPKLLELGSVTCIPCKMMAPILDEMQISYAEQFNVEFIDTGRNKSVVEKYSVRVIPTQIFFDASEKELFRHEGFFAKDDILAKWKELGYNFIATNEEHNE